MKTNRKLNKTISKKMTKEVEIIKTKKGSFKMKVQNKAKIVLPTNGTSNFILTIDILLSI